MSAKRICSQLLDLIFPPRCQVCRRLSRDLLCETCLRAALFIGERRCACCGGPLRDSPPEALPGGLCPDCRERRWISGARSVGLHATSLREAVIAYKFRGRRRLAHVFAQMLVDLARDEVEGPGLPLDHCAAIIPVPLHPRRRGWGGIDQAESLCHGLAEPLGLPVWTDVLVRVRDTTPQVSVPGNMRRTNVSGAFETRKQWRLAGGSVILVDDVMTTGSTLDECARVLKMAGAVAVYALTITRALPGWHPHLQTLPHLRAGGAADA